VIAYDTAPWHDLFVATTGAAAALDGLLFVAVSLNLEQILKLEALPPLAARSLGTLLGILLMSVLILTPGQSRVVLGVEITALGLILTSAMLVSTAHTHIRAERWQWAVSAFVLSTAASVPMLIAGVTLILGRGGGLYWALVEVIAGVSISIYYAWVLLVEILR